MELVDAHHHFFDLSGSAGGYPGMRGAPRKTAFGTDEALRRDYLPADYAVDLGAMGGTRSVHVEAARRPDDPVEETRWLAGIAAQGGLPCAIVAQADLTRDEAPDIVARHAAEKRVRGIRQIKGISGALATLRPEDTLFAVPAWRRNLAALARHGLVCELQAPPTVAAIACECVDKNPDIAFVLTHGGHPIDRSAEGLARWRAGLDRFAARPNVAVKLSGFYMMNPHETDAGLAELIAQIVDRFGPARCMFGSNYPVDRLFVAPARLRAAFDAALSRYTAAECREIFAGTATRIYKLDPLQHEER
jgi:predicted TIM-barrel fold metal-dependent hydrolase